MTGVSMRTVPRRTSLGSPRKCSTNLGNSAGPTRSTGNQSTGWPSLPAIAVNVPHSWATRPGSANSCLLRRGMATARATAKVATSAIVGSRGCRPRKASAANIAFAASGFTASRLCLPGRRGLGQQFGDRFAALPKEMAGEILGEERVGFCSCHRFLDVVAMLPSGPGKGKERGGELHFGIIAAEPDGLLHKGVAVDPASRILRRCQPLLVGFREITHIKIVESRR